MKFRKKPVEIKTTLRRMSPTTRKCARLIGELASVTRRMKNLLSEIRDTENQAQQWQGHKQAMLDRMTGRWGATDLIRRLVGVTSPPSPLPAHSPRQTSPECVINHAPVQLLGRR